MITGAFRCGLGRALARLGRFEEAESELLESDRALLMTFDASHVRVQKTQEALVDLYERWEKPVQAELWRTSPAAARQQQSPVE